MSNWIPEKLQLLCNYQALLKIQYEICFEIFPFLGCCTTMTLSNNAVHHGSLGSHGQKLISVNIVIFWRCFFFLNMKLGIYENINVTLTKKSVSCVFLPKFGEYTTETWLIVKISFLLEMWGITFCVLPTILTQKESKLPDISTNTIWFSDEYF